MMRIFDEWLLLPQRIAVHEPTGTAVLADAHLGYSAARQRLGDAVPWRTVADEMQPLADAAKNCSIRSLVVAGDLFERGFAADLYDEFRAVLASLQIEFRGLVPGNHDRGVDKARGLPLFPHGFDLAGWRIVHGDQTCESTRVIMGHWHPALRGQGGKAPCFLAREWSLVLPAFSLDAAGVDVGADVKWRTWDRYAVQGSAVLAVGRGRFLPRRQRP